MILYIVRHGQTELNLKHVLQGNSDSPLTEKGIAGARMIGKKFEDISFSRVYSSNLKRAMKTAEIIMEGRDFELIKDPDVAEMSFGQWQGKTQEEISQTPELEENYVNYFRHPDQYIPTEGAESFPSVLARARRFLDKMEKLSLEENSNVLLVSHGAFIKAILSEVKGLDLKDFWSEPYISNCSISRLEIKDGEIRLLGEAEVDHLGQYEIKMSASGYLKRKEKND